MSVLSGLMMATQFPRRGGDPLIGDVILLMQRGVLVDTSSYARSVGQATANSVLANQTVAGFPSGKGVYINGAHNNRGIQFGNGTEMNLNTTARCFEAVVLLDVGAHGGGAQVFYNDGFGFGGTVWFAKVTDGNLGLRVDGPEIYANGPYYVPENIPYYIGCQIPTGPLSADNLPSFWAAPLTDLTVTLRASLASVARPVLDVDQEPYTGYVGGSGGVNAYHIDMLRITNGVRYTPGQTIPVPTGLWPEA